MKRPASASVPTPKTLVQANADFTAEGAPPPGKVAGAVGAGVPATRHAASRTPANIPGARHRAPTGKRR